MLQDLIKLAIKKINAYGDMKYTITKGDDTKAPQIIIKHKNGCKETVVEDLELITSITATENTLMLYEEGCISIISPGEYTYHCVC